MARAAAAPSPAVIPHVSSTSSTLTGSPAGSPDGGEEESEVVLDINNVSLSQKNNTALGPSSPANNVVSSVVSRISLAWRDVYYQVAINDKQTREIRTCISGRLLIRLGFAAL